MTSFQDLLSTMLFSEEENMVSCQDPEHDQWQGRLRCRPTKDGGRTKGATYTTESSFS